MNLSICCNMNLSISVIAMPSCINTTGDIFGGWLLSQMDLAGIVECKKYSPGKYVTIAIDKMKFVKHVSVGDLVKIYSKIEKIGNTSITIFMKAYVDRLDNNDKVQVTHGLFTYVKIDDNNNDNNDSSYYHNYHLYHYYHRMVLFGIIFKY